MHQALIPRPACAGARAILFDFDGTLADTAPDLGAAVNAMRTRRGLRPLSQAELRPWASHGARGLVGIGFGVTPADAEFEALKLEFLAEYGKALCVHTRLFEGMPAVLERLDGLGLRWGIVTNKLARYTAPIVRALAIDHRAAVIVSGDTTPHAKPHPAPLLHAAAVLELAPGTCVYVGDDERDIQAGRAAGMRTVAAAFGYCAGLDPHAWMPDAVIDRPAALLGVLGLDPAGLEITAADPTC